MAGFAAGFRPSLDKHEMERLARITRKNLRKTHAHNETVRHLQEIRRRQLVANYEINTTTCARPPFTGHWAAPLSSAWLS